MMTHFVAFTFLPYFKNISHNIHTSKFTKQIILGLFLHGNLSFVLMEISLMMMMIIDNIAIRLTLCQALFQITLPLTPPCPRNIYF